MEELEEDDINEEEEEDDVLEAEFEVIDPPYMVREPTHRWGYNGHTPPGHMILRGGGGTRGSIHLSGWSEGFMILAMEGMQTEPFRLDELQGASTSSQVPHGTTRHE